MENINDDQLHEQINRANKIKDLAEHPGFILIMESLKRDADEALETLKITPALPENLGKMQELQNTIWRHDEFAARMYTILEIGLEAQRELAEKGEEYVR